MPQPYNPDPTAYFGDRKCLVVHHDYTTRQQLLDDYFYPDSNYILSRDRNHDSDEGPKFYMNFPPVQVSCPTA
ncbi:hypothetical protein ACFV2U_12655 [Streptomyces sp. NPDC059697]|uniref:hypothetical protein n=1 Tax=Streptomyces sp. NPDC059697 TaxID=3346912 RepID=UPI00367DE6A3